MKVVVIGGTGNISTSIVKLLLEKEHDVTCFNRGKSGKLPKDVRLIMGGGTCRNSVKNVKYI
jgi:nucleoside-diphosphate-sugar epimerase